MNIQSTKMLRRNVDPPTAQELLQGLSEKEISTVFNLILLLKERRKKNSKAKIAKVQYPPDTIHDTDNRKWFLVELMNSFMDLANKDDQELEERLIGWFEDLEQVPKTDYLVEGFPKDTLDLLEGLNSAEFNTAIRLIAFMRREGVDLTFGKDPSIVGPSATQKREL